MQSLEDRVVRKLKSSRVLIAAIAATAAMSGSAFGAITMETDINGVPWTLIQGTGWPGASNNNITVTSDGYVVTTDTQASGNELHILTTSLKKLATVTSGDSQYSLTQGWNTSQDFYSGSVPGNTKVGTLSNVMASGLTRVTPDDTHFGWSGGGSPSVGQIQWQKSDGTYGIQQATRSGMTVAPLALTHYNASVANPDNSSTHRGDLDYVGTVVDSNLNSTKYQLINSFATSGGGNTGVNNDGVMKMEWAEATAPTSTTSGTLSVDSGASDSVVRYLVDSTVAGASKVKSAGMLNNLVPGVSDVLNGLAINPADGNLYFVTSIDTGGNDTSAGGYKWSDDKVYLAAVSFAFGDLTADSPVTYIDLDPNSANNFLEIQWTKPTHADGSSSTPTAELLQAGDLAFSPDGSTLYVSNVTGDRVFMFDVTAAPEPSALGLLGLGGLALLRRRQQT